MCETQNESIAIKLRRTFLTEHLCAMLECMMCGKAGTDR